MSLFKLDGKATQLHNLQQQLWFPQFDLFSSNLIKNKSGNFMKTIKLWVQYSKYYILSVSARQNLTNVLLDLSKFVLLLSEVSLCSALKMHRLNICLLLTHISLEQLSLSSVG